MAYGFSVFWLPLSRALGITQATACPDMTLLQELFTTTCDWRVAGMGWMPTSYMSLDVGLTPTDRPIGHSKRSYRCTELPVCGRGNVRVPSRRWLELRVA